MAVAVETGSMRIIAKTCVFAASATTFTVVSDNLKRHSLHGPWYVPLEERFRSRVFVSYNFENAKKCRKEDVRIEITNDGYSLFPTAILIYIILTLIADWL